MDAAGTNWMGKRILAARAVPTQLQASRARRVRLFSRGPSRVRARGGRVLSTASAHCPYCSSMPPPILGLGCVVINCARPKRGRSRGQHGGRHCRIGTRQGLGDVDRHEPVGWMVRPAVSSRVDATDMAR